MADMKTLWGFPPASVKCVECTFTGSIPELGQHCAETGHGLLSRAAAPRDAGEQTGETSDG